MKTFRRALPACAPLAVALVVLLLGAGPALGDDRDPVAPTSPSTSTAPAPPEDPPTPPTTAEPTPSTTPATSTTEVAPTTIDDPTTTDPTDPPATDPPPTTPEEPATTEPPTTATTTTTTTTTEPAPSTTRPPTTSTEPAATSTTDPAAVIARPDPTWPSVPAAAEPEDVVVFGPPVFRAKSADDSGVGFITDEDTAFLTADVLANDSGDTSTLGVSDYDDSGTIGDVTGPGSGGGEFGYDPAGNFETLPAGSSTTDSWTYIAGDDSGESEPATVTVTINGVNDAPVAESDSVSTDQDTAATGNVLAANGGPADSDIDVGDVLSVSQVEGAGGNVGSTITLGSGATVTVQSDGGFVYDPNGQFDHVSAGDFAFDTFTYQAADGNGGVDTTTVFVAVDGLDDPVVAQPDSGAGFAPTEDAQYTTGSVLANDSDPDDCVISLFVATFTTTTTAGGTLTPGPVEGTFVYDPPANFNGSDTFSYTADSNEVCPDGDLLPRVAGAWVRAPSGLTTVTLAVAPVNDPPVATDDAGAAFATDEDVAFTTGDVLANDTDVDLDILSVSTFDAGSGAGGTVVSNADGTFEYTPPAGFSGDDTFGYSVTDGFLADSGLVTIAVAAGPPPTTSTTTTTTTTSPPTTTTTTTTTTTAPPTTTTPTTPTTPTTVTSGAPPVSVPAPVAGPTVPTTTADDNEPPLVADDRASTTAGDAVVILVTGNDSDPDGALDLSTLTILTQPENGVATVLAGGSISYRPAAGFSGTDSFSYVICDIAAECAVAVVSVQVEPDQAAPATTEPAPPAPQESPPGTEQVLTESACDANTLVAATFGIDPSSGSEGTDVEVQLEIRDELVDECLPPQVSFFFDGMLIAGPVKLSPNPGAFGQGKVPDLPPGTYDVSVVTFTAPPVLLATTEFEITDGGGGGVLDVLPPAPVTVPVAAAAGGLLIIGAAAWRRRGDNHRHPALAALRPDDTDDLEAAASTMFDAAVDARNDADHAALLAAEAQVVAAEARAAPAAEAAVLGEEAQQRGEEAQQAADDAQTAAAEAAQRADDAEARAVPVAGPWWDREARVPRQQVPLVPGADEPAARRNNYYLLTHENPDADEQADGARGWFVPSRDGPISGIVVHTTGTAAAPEVADYYASSSRPVSAHVVVDDHGWIKLLPDDFVAHHAKGADDTLAVEIAYRAADWGSDPFREDVLLRMAAAWCAVRARNHGIPVRQLTAREWRDGDRGFLGHDAVDWRHKDPGDDFPWERFLALVAELAGVDDRAAV